MNTYSENKYKTRFFFQNFNFTYINPEGEKENPPEINNNSVFLKKDENEEWNILFFPLFMKISNLESVELKIDSDQNADFGLIYKNIEGKEFFSKIIKIKKGITENVYNAEDFNSPKWVKEKYAKPEYIVNIGFYIRKKNKQVNLTIKDVVFNFKQSAENFYIEKNPVLSERNGDFTPNSAGEIYFDTDKNNYIIELSANQNLFEWEFFDNRKNNQADGLILNINTDSETFLTAGFVFEDGKQFFHNTVCGNSSIKIEYINKNVLTKIIFYVVSQKKSVIKIQNSSYFYNNVNFEKENLKNDFLWKELYSKDIKKENIKLNMAGAKVDIECGSVMKLDFYGDCFEKNSFSVVDIIHPFFSNFDKNVIESIGIYISGNSKNPVRVIFKGENGEEYWSNPFKINSEEMVFKKIYLKDFFIPDWLENKNIVSQYLKNIAIAVSGEHKSEIIIYKFELNTGSMKKSLEEKQSEIKISDFSEFTNFPDFTSTVTSENIVVSGRKNDKGEISFRILDKKDNFFILRFNMTTCGEMDFSTFTKISNMMRVNFETPLKIMLTDIEDFKVWTETINIEKGMLKKYSFQKQHFVNGDIADINYGMIKFVEFHLNNINNPDNFQPKIIYTMPVLSGQDKNSPASPVSIYIEDFNFFGEKEFRNYWVSSGNDSRVEANGAFTDNELDYPCLKVDFSISSENSLQNWIVMKKNDSEYEQDLSRADFITFLFKSSVKGMKLRFKVRDTLLNESEYEFKNISTLEKFSKVNIPLLKLKGKADLSKVLNYEFYFGLEWAKPPVRGSFYFATYSEKEKTVSTFSLRNKPGKSPQKMISLDNIISKIKASNSKVNLDGNLLEYSQIKPVLDKKLEKNSNVFGIKDIKLEQTKKSKKWGLNEVALFIEPTNLCNLSCIMCNHGDNSFDRSLGVMKYKEFREIAEEIKKGGFNIWEVAPFWLGEPFIHPQITDFIDKLSEVKRIPGNIQHFNIHTNGNVLTDKHVESVVNSELDSILFSIDAADPETYRKIRVNGELDVVMSNIKKLIDRRNSLNRKKPAVIMQFIVMDENVGEIMDFIKLGQNIGINEVIYAGRKEDNIHNLPMKPNLLFPQIDYDLVFIKSLEPNALTKHQKHREILTEVKENIVRRPCGSLWKMFSVAWDGSATACCRDDQVKMPIGNVLKEGVENVWYGEAITEYRIAHILGDFDKVPKCRECVNWVKYPVSDESIESWLISVGEEKLIPLYKKRFGKE
ncbi:MAG: radical SAM protein [Candidatus Muiribacteriota bacterium]